MKNSHGSARLCTAILFLLTATITLAGCSGHGHRRRLPPPPPPPSGVCLGEILPGDTIEWQAAMDYPGDVDEFVVDPAVVSGDMLVRIFGEQYGLDMVFEIYDPFGHLIDVVDDVIGYDPEGLYLIDVCGPWIIRAYSFEPDVGPYDMIAEYS